MYIAERNITVKTRKGEITLTGIAYFDNKDDRNKAIKELRLAFPDRAFRAKTISAKGGVLGQIEYYWIAGEVKMVQFPEGYKDYDRDEWVLMNGVCEKYNCDLF